METLPWDEWGRMQLSYEGKAGPAFDALIGDVAAVCASADPVGLRSAYASEDLSVPAELLRDEEPAPAG